MISKKLSLLGFLLCISNSLVWGMGDEHHHDHGSSAQAVVQQTYHATGVVKSIAENHESLRIFHDPISELKWPSMNMPFEVVDHELTHPLEVGDKVEFDFMMKEGKSIIVRMKKR